MYVIEWMLLLEGFGGTRTKIKADFLPGKIGIVYAD